MKIAIPIFSFSKDGGIERHTYELVKKISADHEIHIFSNRIENKDNLKIIWHKIPAVNFSILKSPSFVLLNSLMLRMEKFDIIYNNGCGATLVQDVITSASCHRAWMEETKKEGLKKHFLNPLHYWTVFIESLNYKNGNYRKVIAISNFIKKHLINYHQIPEDRITVIYHGVNLDEFNPQRKEESGSSIRKKYSLSPDDTVLLFVGNEFKRKGLKFVFEAMKILNNSNLKLLVAGNGEIKAFKALANELGILNNIIFTGYCSDISMLFAASDIFVFPSTFDAFGLVVLEAMASGIPAIVSGSTGASEIIDSGSDGFVVDYNDSKMLSDIIKKLIENREFMTIIGKSARKKAEKYSWDLVAKKTLEVFEDVCRIKQVV